MEARTAMPRMPSGITAGWVTSVCGTTTGVKAATKAGFRRSSTARRHSMVKKAVCSQVLARQARAQGHLCKCAWNSCAVSAHGGPTAAATSISPIVC